MTPSVVEEKIRLRIKVHDVRVDHFELMIFVHLDT